MGWIIDIEKVSANVIQRDFEQDEKLFEKLVRLYNEEQTESQDGFTLRDLSLQCAVNHQKAHIKDITNIKQRHPLIAASLQYAGLCYQIQAYFSSHYHSKFDTDIQKNVAKESFIPFIFTFSFFFKKKK